MRRLDVGLSILVGLPTVLLGVYGVKSFARLAETEQLCEVASQGKNEMVKKYLDAGVDVNGRGWQSTTPLLRAVEGDQVDTAMLLLDRGANIELANNRCTPLVWAVFGNNKKMVVALLERGANPNAKKDERVSSLTIALQEHHPEIAEILRKAGATESLTDE